MVLSITEFLGHFHPVLVHLPIGILLIAVFFQLLAQQEKFKDLHAAAGIALFWGMLSAIVSCISGFLLSKTDDYDESLISKHQWFGIAVAIVSIVAYYLNKKNSRYTKWLLTAMTLLIIITGHLGGSITHGSDYLTKAFSSKNNYSELKRKPIPNIDEAVAYTDVIQPILATRCYSCHGPNKQKGKLRLDEPAFILKGGKDGKVVAAGKADESSLVERIFLPKDNEDHMPPKEKPQLTKQDLELLHWWVSSGADFNKKVNELEQTAKIKPVLLALQTGEINEEINSTSIPDTKVDKASDSIIQKLTDRGISVTPVALNSNYLTANFVAVDSVTSGDLRLLQPLQKQLVWLKLGGKEIRDSALVIIANLSSLNRLYLERTQITDEGLSYLKSLPDLQYINLVGTTVTAKGLAQLKDLKKLKQVFIYQAGITNNDFTYLKKIFPKTVIDTGGYKVAMLATDTILKKPAAKTNN